MLIILPYCLNHQLHISATCFFFFFFNVSTNTLVFLTNPDDKQVWAVLKPGFLALVADPLHTKLLDIIVFDVLPMLEEKEESQACLAYHVKERNPLRYSFKVCVFFFLCFLFPFSRFAVISYIFCPFVQHAVISLHNLFVTSTNVCKIIV